MRQEHDEKSPLGKGRTVLVVDDNTDSASSLAELLRHWGFVAIVANDGPAALAAVQEWAPDVALLDLGLPKMDGYELAAHLRFAPGGQDMTVIAVTGRNQIEDIRASRAKGFVAHLVKPVDLDQLASLIG